MLAEAFGSRGAMTTATDPDHHQRANSAISGGAILHPQ
ncbi:hypothetical protein EKH55_5237 [Sinorhizobium alkalisoli]|nr:hypothetical protein EKH55_5237 [Sinorhizobium alkalisoli]